MSEVQVPNWAAILFLCTPLIMVAVGWLAGLFLGDRSDGAMTDISNYQFYNVTVQDGTEGCVTCGHGRLWTVLYTGGDGEETEIGTSWDDAEAAQDVCDLMNMAYDAGKD